MRLYRFATENPENVRDASNYRPHYDGTNLKPFPPQMLCQACGLSVFTDVDEVTRLKKLPIFRPASVAIVEPQDGSGVWRNTPSKRTGDNHHTFWVALNVEIQDSIVGELP